MKQERGRKLLTEAIIPTRVNTENEQHEEKYRKQSKENLQIRQGNVAVVTKSLAVDDEI